MRGRAEVSSGTWKIVRTQEDARSGAQDRWISSRATGLVGLVTGLSRMRAVGVQDRALQDWLIRDTVGGRRLSGVLDPNVRVDQDS